MDPSNIKRREQFFTNLLLLGFDVAYMHRKHHTGFHKDMFIVPNKKGFEVVTYFLFNKLSEITNKEYKLFWPVTDKKQEYEFRKTSFEYITKIAKEEENGIKFPRIFQTLLMSPGGEKFYELYLALTTYILLKQIKKDSKCHLLNRPSLTAENQQTVKSILQISSNNSVKKFIEVQKEALVVQEKWEKTAEDFISYCRRTKQNIVEKEKLLKEKINTFYFEHFQDGANLHATDEEKVQEIALKNSSDFEEVQKIFQSIEFHLEEEKQYWEIIKTELDSECTEKYALIGDRYMIQVPETLIKVCKNELQERKVQSLQDNGKLSVKNFVNLWIVCLNYYIKTLQEGLPITGSIIPRLKLNIQELSESLKTAKFLREKLELSILPDMTSKIKEMEARAFSSVRATILEEQMIELPPFNLKLDFSPKYSSADFDSEKLFLFSNQDAVSCTVGNEVLTNEVKHSVVSDSAYNSKLFLKGSDCEEESSLKTNSSFSESKVVEEHNASHISIISDVNSKHMKLNPSNSFYSPQTDVGYSSLLDVSDPFDHSATVSDFNVQHSYLHSMNSLKSDKVINLKSQTGEQVSNRRQNYNYEKVEKKLVDKIVHGILNCNLESNVTGDFNVSREELRSHEDSFDPLDEKIFTSKDKLTRTPDNIAFDSSAVSKIKNMNVLQCTTDLHVDDRARNSPLTASLLTSLPDEEMLSSVTLPSIPFDMSFC